MMLDGDTFYEGKKFRPLVAFVTGNLRGATNFATKVPKTSSRSHGYLLR